MFLIAGCAQLEGVLPKIKPKKDEDISPVDHSPATVAAKQDALSEENQQLLTKIEKLEQAHNLLSLVSNAVEYQPYTTNIHTTADTALKQGKGGLSRSCTYNDCYIKINEHPCKICKWLHA